MATWNTAFEQTPAGSESPSLGDDRFRELKVAVRERLEKEHVMDLTGGIAGDDGWHESGSAKVYFQSAAPTTRPDGATSLTAADNGRIWMSSTDYKLRVYNHAAGSTPADRWVLQNDEFPVGLIAPFAGETAVIPTGWLPCTGGAVSRTDYASLHAILKDVGGTNAYGWGSGDGSTTFNLPDLRELYLVGVGTRAAGITAHDAFNLAQMKDDQLQDHYHSYLFGNNTGAADQGPQTAISPRGDNTTGVTKGLVSSPTGGTPRTGTVTRGKGAGVNYIIKARTADPNYTVENASLDARLTILEGLGFSLRNALDNGDFLIDQRNEGAAKTLTAGTTRIMTVDRWYGYSTTVAASAQRVAGSTRQYGLKITGAASNTGVVVGQNIDAANAARFKGKTSFLGVVGFADAARDVTWTVKSMQSVDTIGTPVTIATGTMAFTTTPTRFSVSFNAGTNAANGLIVEFSIGTLVSGQYLQFEAAQLERSDIATTFEERPAAVERLLCNRYLRKSYPDGTVPGTNSSVGMHYFMGSTDGSTDCISLLALGASMRRAPTMTFYAADGTLGSWNYTRSGATALGTPVSSIGHSGGYVYVKAGATAGTAPWVVCGIYGHWVADAEF